MMTKGGHLYHLLLFICWWNGFSQQNILTTDIPRITSFISCILLAVASAVFFLKHYIPYVQHIQSHREQNILDIISFFKNVAGHTWIIYLNLEITG